MIHGQRILAIIPARAGSKRLPGKNMKLFHGKPLLEWSIIAAKGSKYIDEIVLSSDIPGSDAIALRNHVYWMRRQPDLATDAATLEAVCADVVERPYLIDGDGEMGQYYFDLIILLQPTSPLRTTADIDAAIESFFAPLDSLISLWYTNGQLRPNGAIYIKRTNRILQDDKFYQPHHSKIFLMPPERSIDIDTQSDFDEALNASQNELPE